MFSITLCDMDKPLEVCTRTALHTHIHGNVLLRLYSDGCMVIHVWQTTTERCECGNVMNMEKLRREIWKRVVTDDVSLLMDIKVVDQIFAMMTSCCLALSSIFYIWIGGVAEWLWDDLVGKMRYNWSRDTLSVWVCLKRNGQNINSIKITYRQRVANTSNIRVPDQHQHRSIDITTYLQSVFGLATKILLYLV